MGRTVSIFKRKRNRESSETLVQPSYSTENLQKLHRLVMGASEDEIRASLGGDFSQLTYDYGTWEAKAQAAMVLQSIGKRDPYLTLSKLDYMALVHIAEKNKVVVKATKEELIDDILMATFGEKRPDSGFDKMIDYMKKEQERQSRSSVEKEQEKG